MIPGTIDLKLIDECVSVTDANLSQATRSSPNRSPPCRRQLAAAPFSARPPMVRTHEARAAVLSCRCAVARQRKPLSLEDFQSAWLNAKECERGLGERPLERG